MIADYFYLSDNCSGHGDLFQVSPDAGLAFSSYCICHPGYSGQADFFDLRVQVPGVSVGSNVETSLDCTIPDLGVLIVWSIVLSGYTFRLVIISLALRKKWKHFDNFQRTMRAKNSISYWKAAFSYLPFQVLSMDLVGALSMLIACSYKLANPANAVFGTSAFATVFFLCSFLFVGSAWAIYEVRTVATLAGIPNWNGMLDNPLTRLPTISAAGAMLSVLCVSIISLAQVGLDKSNGPGPGGLDVILLLRSILMCLFAILSYVLFSRSIQMARDVRAKLDSSQGPVQQTTRVLAFLESNGKNTRLKVIMIFVVYFVMGLPWVYPYIYIPLGFINAFNNTTGVGIEFFREVPKGENSQISSAQYAVINAESNAVSDMDTTTKA